jgi:hypothetical protein
LSGPETPPVTRVFHPARSIRNVVELLRHPRGASGVAAIKVTLCDELLQICFIVEIFGSI